MKKNIVLIGMPGCGKTTIGEMLAKRLGFGFADVDERVEARAGMSVAEIFARRGESAFRDLESEIIAELGRLKKCVIAAGGGSVLREQNMAILKESGYIFFIDRPLESLLSGVDITTRPLLKTRDSLKQLYEQRYGLYLKYCDFRIENSAGPAEAVNKIYDLVKRVLK